MKITRTWGSQPTRERLRSGIAYNERRYSQSDGCGERRRRAVSATKEYHWPLRVVQPLSAWHLEYLLGAGWWEGMTLDALSYVPRRCLEFSTGLHLQTCSVWGNESHLRLNLRQPIFLQHGAHGSHASPRPLMRQNVSLLCFLPVKCLPPRIFPVEKTLGRRPCFLLSLRARSRPLTLAVWCRRVWHPGNPPRYIYRYLGLSQLFPDAASRKPVELHNTPAACGEEGP
jgi:hypothetical protein